MKIAIHRSDLIYKVLLGYNYDYINIWRDMYEKTENTVS